ncbi:Making large colonies protein [Chromobacterium violaceum]|uniref:Making large colonies protein n=1 Tax=Chromobacterium violaceum TaxID=536 RepID=A0A447TFP9_CHRVL|nr:Making large colonies protein [Chromobacterium violaceum]
MTALTPQTVSNIAAELLDAGMLLAGEPLREGGRGQPAIPLSLNPDGAYAVGMQLDHQMLVALALDLSGQARFRLELAVDRPTPDQALPLIAGLLQRLRQESGLDWGACWAGAGDAGPFGWRHDLGRPTTLPGWEGVDSASLTRALGLPVLLEKDATAAAIGERLYGTASTLRNFVYLFVGAGLGAGLFLDGRLYTGGRRNAGEVGHMMVVPDGRPCDCGNRGCLERYVSLQALYEALGIAGGRSPRQSTWGPRHRCRRPALAGCRRGPLKQAINILESLLDIDAVVLGGLLPPAWQEALLARLHPLPLSVRSSSGDRLRLGSAGATWWRWARRPCWYSMNSTRNTRCC